MKVEIVWFLLILTILLLSCSSEENGIVIEDIPKKEGQIRQEENTEEPNDRVISPSGKEYIKNRFE